jgi:hypothetical protein
LANGLKDLNEGKCSFEEMMDKNVAKLKARYPNKFTQESALNRDLAKERAVLEDALTGTMESEINKSEEPVDEVAPKEQLQKFEIWDNDEEPMLHVKKEGLDFQDACNRHFNGNPAYDSNALTFYDFKLFPSKEEAMKHRHKKPKDPPPPGSKVVL